MEYYFLDFDYEVNVIVLVYSIIIILSRSKNIESIMNDERKEYERGEKTEKEGLFCLRLIDKNMCSGGIEKYAVIFGCYVSYFIEEETNMNELGWEGLGVGIL
jgi:hypothetical protein